MGRAFRLDDVEGDLELRTGTILRAAELRQSGELVPRDRFGTWTLRTHQGAPIRLNVYEHRFDFRLMASCSAAPHLRIVGPGIPRWLAWLAVVPALLALPNLCMGPAGLCGMVIPFGLAGIGRAIAAQRGWTLPLRAVLVSTLTFSWLALQVAVGLWVLNIIEDRHAVAARAPISTVGSGPCVGTYGLAVGPTVSPVRAYLAEHLHEGEQLATGPIGAELTSTRVAGLGTCRVRMSLHQHQAGSRTTLDEGPVDLLEPDYVFNRSWQVSTDGEFEVVVSEDATGAVLASRRFLVAVAPIAPPSTVAPCVGEYGAVIGPAVSADSPHLEQHLGPGEHLHVDDCVALELRPADATHFPACRMRFALYYYTVEGRRILVESELDMSVADVVFTKTWLVHQTGDFEIAVTDVSTGARLATERFTVD